MAKRQGPLLSVVVPVYNEADGLKEFHLKLTSVVNKLTKNSYEIIYSDDGSLDATSDLVRSWHIKSSNIKLLRLSRNFGKESALAAGLAAAQGRAILMLDGDGQHPINIVPEFFKAWQNGAQVVVGVREQDHGANLIKRLGSKVFYKSFNRLTGEHLIPGSTDFRLIDRAVLQAFIGLKETNRITRGLIDWLGFRRVILKFRPNRRLSGKPAYSIRKLMELAANSFVSLSPQPLYWFGSLGIIITVSSLLLGVAVFVEQILLGDPGHWKFTGTAMLVIVTLFLVGIILMSQGILSLYISHIHSQSKGRPLYVIDYDHSAGISNET